MPPKYSSNFAGYSYFHLISPFFTEKAAITSFSSCCSIVKARPLAIEKDEWPSPMSLRHTTLGPSLGQLVEIGCSLYIPSLFGPRYEVQ